MWNMKRCLIIEKCGWKYSSSNQFRERTAKVFRVQFFVKGHVIHWVSKVRKAQDNFSHVNRVK